jgi:hypothetical protein
LEEIEHPFVVPMCVVLGCSALSSQCKLQSSDEKSLTILVGSTCQNRGLITDHDTFGSEFSDPDHDNALTEKSETSLVRQRQRRLYCALSFGPPASSVLPAGLQAQVRSAAVRVCYGDNVRLTAVDQHKNSVGVARAGGVFDGIVFDWVQPPYWRPCAFVFSHLPGKFVFTAVTRGLWCTHFCSPAPKFLTLKLS